LDTASGLRLNSATSLVTLFPMPPCPLSSPCASSPPRPSASAAPPSSHPAVRRRSCPPVRPALFCLLPFLLQFLQTPSSTFKEPNRTKIHPTGVGLFLHGRKCSDKKRGASRFTTRHPAPVLALLAAAALGARLAAQGAAGLPGCPLPCNCS
jgi:hypothetical protein